MRPGSSSFTATSKTKIPAQAASWISLRRSPALRGSSFRRTACRAPPRRPLKSRAIRLQAVPEARLAHLRCTPQPRAVRPPRAVPAPLPPFRSVFLTGQQARGRVTRAAPSTVIGSRPPLHATRAGAAAPALDMTRWMSRPRSSGPRFSAAAGRPGRRSRGARPHRPGPAPIPPSDRRPRRPPRRPASHGSRGCAA